MLRVTAAMAAIVFLCAFKPSDAPENSPQVSEWFQSAHNRKGESCCGEADGYRLHTLYAWGAVDEDIGGKREIFDDYETRGDGHYWLHIVIDNARKGIWVDGGGPEDAITPNKAGVAIVWLRFINGIPVVLCFAPDTGI